MRCLAIDTAAEACAVAVSGGAGGPVLLSELIGRGHAERLFPMIDEALSRAGIAVGALARIAVTVGPGSFTGLRVGVAAARGLGLATGAELVGVTTLAVHAARARALAGAVPVLAVLDAKRGEIYGQAFDGEGHPLAPPRADTAEAFAAMLRPGMRLAASGARLVAAARDDAATRIVHEDTAPDLAALLALALAAPASAEPPKPLYLRPPDAKPQGAAKVLRR
jgi:tRNA threonylcarbamoyl adenosine modification protein YeaZ